MDNKFLLVLKSRKFWSSLLAVLAAVGAYFYGELDIWQMVQAIVAACAAYAIGTGIEDAGLSK